MGFLGIKKYDVNPEKLPQKMWFMVYVMGVLSIIILGVVLFKFPVQEKINGKVEIYHQGVAHKVKAKTSGDLKLYVDEGESINRGDILGMINWDVDLETYNELREISVFYINKGNISEFQKLLSTVKHKEIPLIQGELSSLVTSSELYMDTYNLVSNRDFENYQKKRINSLKANKRINEDLVKGRKEKTAIILQQIEADSILLADGIISKRSFEQRKQELIEEILKIEERALLIESSNESIENVNSSLAQSKFDIELIRLENYKSLLVSLEIFKKKFFDISELSKITSSSSGVVELMDILKFSNNVTQGGDLMRIQPKVEGADRMARIITGIRNTGRVEKGNRVMIYLDQYPLKDYGVLSATIKDRNDIIENDTYIFDISLPNGLKMSYGETIDPEPLLSGEGYILVNRTNIYDLVINEFRKRRTEYFK